MVVDRKESETSVLRVESFFEGAVNTQYQNP